MRRRPMFVLLTIQSARPGASHRGEEIQSFCVDRLRDKTAALVFASLFNAQDYGVSKSRKCVILLGVRKEEGLYADNFYENMRSVANWRHYKMIGNAVPVNFAKAIAEAAYKTIN